MPSSQTPNYNLNQWSRDDRVLMEDFNADNAKLDAAIKAVEAKADTKADVTALDALAQTVAEKPRLAAGHYTGDGAATRFISTGFTPKAVLVIMAPGYLYTISSTSSSSYSYGGLAVTGYPGGHPNAPSVEIVSGGFRVFCKTDTRPTLRSNQANEGYNYIALG